MYTNRESWLHAFNEKAAPIINGVLADLDSDHEFQPSNIRIGVGFPSTGRRGNRIGEAWSHECSGDKKSEIIISNLLENPARVAGVLVHENVHVIVGLAAKHGPKFKKVATALGLEGKMTATTEGPLFYELFESIVEELGPYPHAKLSSQGSGPKKQSTRQRKCECRECGIIFRMAKSHMERLGGFVRCPDPACDGEVTLDMGE